MNHAREGGGERPAAGPRGAALTSSLLARLLKEVSPSNALNTLSSAPAFRPTRCECEECSSLSGDVGLARVMASREGVEGTRGNKWRGMGELWFGQRRKSALFLGEAIYILEARCETISCM